MEQTSRGGGDGKRMGVGARLDRGDGKMGRGWKDG